MSIWYKISIELDVYYSNKVKFKRNLVRLKKKKKKKISSQSGTRTLAVLVLCQFEDSKQKEKKKKKKKRRVYLVTLLRFHLPCLPACSPLVMVDKYSKLALIKRSVSERENRPLDHSRLTPWATRAFINFNNRKTFSLSCAVDCYANDVGPKSLGDR